MAIVANGYRLGHAPYKRGLGALTTIYNGRGTLFTNAMVGSVMRGSAWLFGEYAGRPVGNLHPRSWMLPQKSGYMSMRTVGSGTVSSDLIPSYPMSIDLTGSGDLEATGALVVSMLAALSGSGTLSANIYGYLNMTCDLEGSGDLTGAMEGIASMACDLLGTGDIDATIAAYGNMEIDIVVTGSGLTTANVGNSVWGALGTLFNDPGTMGNLLNMAGSGGVDYNLLADAVWERLIDAGYSAEELMRVFAAVLAGKVSGAGSGTETFRGINDDKDRVVATVDVDGNRSNIVIDDT